LAGVGYTTAKNATNMTRPDIWSGEWSWGAVFMTMKLADEYKKMGKGAWAADLLADSKSMVSFMEKAVVPAEDGVWKSGGLVQKDGSYLYANKRFFIPWGWYANPIGATSSTAWAVFYNMTYDPFVLGGYFDDNVFLKEQCKHNQPEAGMIDKLNKWYNY